MDYDHLSLNLAGGSAVAGALNVNAIATTNSIPEGEPSEGSMCGNQEHLEVKSKEKARRYWTPSEEERLYEIWGRENWRLTRNGKNTVYFAQWSEELRERFAVDVKPEEIQMKVNQTRAKFRQVKKQLQGDPTSYPLRWKKYDIINRILKNIHRPKNAEPLPPEVLLNNRDVSPPRDEEQQPQQQQEPQQQQQQQAPQPPHQQQQQHQPQQHQPQQQQQQQSVLNLTTEATANNYYSSNSNNSSGHGQGNSNNNSSSSNHNNTNNNNSSTMSFNTELFTDQYDDIKQEYDDEDYRSMPFQEQMQQYSPAEPTQLLELQTRQQQEQQQQQQQHHQQQQQFQPGYEQSVVSYAGAGVGATALYNNSSSSTVAAAVSNSNCNSVASTSSVNHQAITAVAYINSTNNTISVATNNSSNGGPSALPMQPPAMNMNSTCSSNAIMATPTPRKRGRPFGSSNPPAADSLESLYMEEVRRKNQLLAEQTKISRQRLELEERKVELLQTFFPKCLEQQAHILARVMQLPHLQQQQQPPPQ